MDIHTALTFGSFTETAPLPNVLYATYFSVALLYFSTLYPEMPTYSSINPALWEAAANNDGAFYEGVSSYSASKIKGTSVVDKMISVKSLIHKSDLDANYDSDKDTEKTSWPYKEYVKEANGALKTKTAVIVAGPQAGTQYFYFVKAFANAQGDCPPQAFFPYFFTFIFLAEDIFE